MSTSSVLEICVLTPPGRGAVAVIAVNGPQTAQALSGLFHSSAGLPPDQLSAGRIYHGHWGTLYGEEVVLCRCDATTCEIHCHGGAAAVARIVNDLRNAGASQRDWRCGAGPTGQHSLEHAALVALAEARTERAASILLDQWHGALRRELQAVATALAEADSDLALARLHTLLSHRDAGLHLTTSFKVALAGRPNVGKSSLLNAIAGFERAIVFDMPGTTRDVLALETAIDGWPVCLADMAGLRDSQDPLEYSGVQAARDYLQTVDLVVLVLDASAPITGEDTVLRAAFPQALVVANKGDLLIPPAGPPAGVALTVSAVTGQGVPDLLRAISCRLVSALPVRGAAVPFTPQHFERLERLLQAICRHNVTLAQSLLAAELGELPRAASSPAPPPAGSL